MGDCVRTLGTFAAIRGLENEDMIVDLNNGELVPPDQIVRDPLHLDQIDQAREDAPGCLRLRKGDLSRIEEPEEEQIE